MHQSFRDGFEKTASMGEILKVYGKNALIGSAPGAVIGAASAEKGDRLRGAIRGAAIGAGSTAALTGVTHGTTHALLNGKISPSVGLGAITLAPAAIGAATGALTAEKGHRGEGALKGALIGGGAHAGMAAGAVVRNQLSPSYSQRSFRRLFGMKPPKPRNAFESFLNKHPKIDDALMEHLPTAGGVLGAIGSGVGANNFIDKD
jgi:hypothetical protein